jgi:hypothetical protein
MNSPWHILEDVPAHSAAAADWDLHLGDDYPAAREAFLQKAKRKASSVQCPQVEGCTHELKPRGDGYVAKCKDDDGAGCDDFPVSAEAAEVWEVNLKRLGAAIAGALKCVVKDEKLELDRTRQIASLGTAPPLPILLTVQHDKDGFSDVVARLVARWPKGFVLLAPSSRFCTATATDLLGRANAGFFDLETHVELLGSGKLHAPKSGAELFKAHLPEMKDTVRETDLVRALELFGGLMGLGINLKKAPPALVFDLMVFKKKTKAETATACKCVASLITKRVALIEDHFHMPMVKLLALSSSMQERLRTVKGDRYAKKKHGATRDEPEQYKDDDDAAPPEEYRYEKDSADD